VKTSTKYSTSLRQWTTSSFS